MCFISVLQVLSTGVESQEQSFPRMRNTCFPTVGPKLLTFGEKPAQLHDWASLYREGDVETGGIHSKQINTNLGNSSSTGNPCFVWILLPGKWEVHLEIVLCVSIGSRSMRMGGTSAPLAHTERRGYRITDNMQKYQRTGLGKRWARACPLHSGHGTGNRELVPDLHPWRLLVWCFEIHSWARFYGLCLFYK